MLLEHGACANRGGPSRLKGVRGDSRDLLPTCQASQISGVFAQARSNAFFAKCELESVDTCAQNGRELTQDVMGWQVATWRTRQRMCAGLRRFQAWLRRGGLLAPIGRQPIDVGAGRVPDHRRNWRRPKSALRRPTTKVVA